MTPNNKSQCCDKCYDVYFEKTWPAHTAYDACKKPSCSCHTSKPTKRAGFIGGKSTSPSPLRQELREETAAKDIISFIDAAVMFPKDPVECRKLIKEHIQDAIRSLISSRDEELLEKVKAVITKVGEEYAEVDQTLAFAFRDSALSEIERVIRERKI